MKIYVGLKVGQLTVLEKIGNLSTKKTYYRCLCSCGVEINRLSNVLYRAITKNIISSCGCRQKTEELRRQYGTSRFGKRETELSQKYPENYGKTASGSYAAIIINEMRNKARARCKAWNLNDLEAFELCLQPCHYCGLEVSFPESRNGLDRVDNSKGYESENVVSCCKWCNSAKMERTLEEFKDWITKAYNKIT